MPINHKFYSTFNSHLLFLSTYVKEAASFETASFFIELHIFTNTSFP